MEVIKSSIDLSLISVVLRDQSILEALNFGITKDLLEGPAQKMWDFIFQFNEKNGVVPSREAFDLVFGESKIELYDINAPVKFLCEEIINRHLYERLKKLQYNYDQLMSSDTKPMEMVKSFSSEINEISNISTGEVQLKLAPNLRMEVMQRYALAAEGKLGIPTLCKGMDEATGGWCVGDINFFVARNGIGKTWALILAAHKAAKQDKKVLFLSAELSETDVVWRHMSLYGGLPYQQFRRGKLSEFNMARFQKMYVEYERFNNFIVSDIAGGADTMKIEVLISRSKPDIVFIDAAYRIDSFRKSASRFENFANVVVDLKSIAKRQKVPIIGSTQLNRDAKKKKENEMGDEDIAMSDVLSWEGTNVIGMFQTDDDKKNKIMQFKPLKLRDGEKPIVPIKLNWDLSVMNFSEIVSASAFMKDNIDNY